jgi:CheY-like chemotaxis protein
VLVVDDNVDAADSLVALLEMWGHEAHARHDGPAVASAVSALRPEVVLLDIGLPGMDGYEVARQLRDLPGEPAPLLVAITGYGQPEDRRRSESAGFDVHLTKPVDPERLRELLADLD